MLKNYILLKIILLSVRSSFWWNERTKVYEMLALAMDKDTAITHKSFSIFDENIRENLKSIINNFLINNEQWL